MAMDRRSLLLRAYRGRLRTEDLEDCYSQATLELVVRARRGDAFGSAAHIANALEQKLCSRIGDRHRALGGRSAMEAALAGALCLGDPDGGGVDVADLRPRVEEAVESRMRLREVLAAASGLTRDQRLVLAAQLQLDLSPREFCAHFQWSPDKYRKVSQRGRARLRTLLAVQGIGDGPPLDSPAQLATSVMSLGPASVGDGIQDSPMIPSPLTHRRVHGDSGERPQSVSAIKLPRLRQRRSSARMKGVGAPLAGGPAVGAVAPAAGVAGTASRLDPREVARGRAASIRAAGSAAETLIGAPGRAG